MEELIQRAILSSKKIRNNSLIEKIIPVGGGCIHAAWCIKFRNGKRVFAKSNHIDNINMFEFERECLLLLKRFANKSYICVPKTIDLISFQKISLLILEWVDIKQSKQNLLGKGLALLHKSSSECSQKNFGWQEEGFIGLSTQKRGWDPDWGAFFVNNRLRPQLIQAQALGIRVEDYEDVLIYISSYLNEHNPRISMVHGDLWSGNCGTTKNGLGSIYDPASYWADREVDIAMTKLFGGFNKEFYQGYEEIWPLDKLSNSRTDIYNLYHLLNHANMFGGSYIESSLKKLKDLRSRI